MDPDSEHLVFPHRPCFLLGRLHLTPGVGAALKEARRRLGELLALHQGGVWGEVGIDRIVENERACESEDEIISAFTLRTGDKVWLVTDGSRQYTAVFLASEVC